ncbi:SDR family oxidoreductase [Micromonospora sp. HM5-17]|jgi:NAD(P)-dependent dehydrogenase (short-subunit alcohol dehydrogenase family)|uniref:SDR family oxidoreductase n=1 Tax=Micromonospora sp. HM5-17 TaxID=2487710 RepID=UPI000F49F25E|nr:SDR family oxidoreductase [Micromonospora sp. HM5-17]ROT33853.1 SDR family oxidoreductase [Micromonospora sp. HM5-17]
MISDSTRVALVTGANRGIGRAIARGLGKRGCHVYLGARDEGRGRAAERELRAEGLDVHFIRLDVTDEFSVTLAAKRIEEEVGRLDSLVNNAGIGGPPLPPSQTPIEQVRRTFETNVFGVITVTNTMMPLLRRSAAGRIVNVSSLLGSLRHAADRTDPTGVFPPGVFPAVLDYNTSKAALNAITVTYANELRDTGILVNAVSPGFVATDINDHRGVLTPEQGARIPVLLATLGDDGPTAAFLTEDGTPTGRRLEW